MTRALHAGVVAFLCFADVKEEPVGLVLSATGSKLLRADTETPLTARPGDLLFTGDGLRTETGPASFLFCPGEGPRHAAAIRRSPPRRQGAQGENRQDFRAAGARLHVAADVARGRRQPAALRRQHDARLEQARGPAHPARQTCPPMFRPKLAPYEAVLAANPKDQAALVTEATIFENHKLIANALDMYYKLREQWPDAVWIKSKIFDLEQALADQAAAATAAAPTGGQTYALLVGISKYAKPELSLQFANADASVFGKLLESPRGGSVPSGNVLLLTDEKATTAAVRNGFQDFLKRRAGKNDTVVILIAGHGTVEVPGSKNAFILTYDSDPQDLKSTALAMDELQSLFEEQLTKVGRVLLFVDVCKAGTIGTIHNTTVSVQRPAARRYPRRSFRTAGQPPARSFARRARVWRRAWRLQLLRHQGPGRRGRREQGRRGGRRRADQVRQRSSADGDREQAASARVRHLRQHDAAVGYQESRASMCKTTGALASDPGLAPRRASLPGRRAARSGGPLRAQSQAMMDRLHVGHQRGPDPAHRSE